jgi:GNAT superfamily N-acetyltransferase
MMRVREATMNDLDVMIGIARPYIERSSYAAYGPLCEDACRNLVAMVLERGILLVAETDDVVLGLLGALVVPLMTNAAVLGASEVIFFVRDDLRAARGASRHLLRALEAECRARGLRFLQVHAMHSSPPPLFSLYHKQGYRPTEYSFTKAL